MTFSNGVSLSLGTSDISVLENIVNILGEPCEIDGKISPERRNAVYYWRDSEGLHQLMVSVKSEGDHFEIRSISYINRTLPEE